MKLSAALCIFIFSLFTAHFAAADILFLDMNNSPKEVEAAQRAAKKRGERLVVIPTMSQESRKRYAEAESNIRRLSNEFESNNCFSGTAGGNCAQIISERRLAYDELKKHSPNANSETIKAALLELKKEGSVPSSVIISGHDGSGSFSGVFGNTSAEELGKVFDELGMNESVRSIHLWGCYTTTLGSIELYWKKNFPHLALLTGYNGLAPLNDKPAGWNYLEGVLSKEKDLIEAGDLKKLQKLFKSIPNVGMVHAAICADELYVSNTEATTVDAAFNVCEQNITELEAEYETYLCYAQASNPECADVPKETGSGPLRAYYNKLHDSRHCSELEQFRSRLKKLPSPDQLIRLIHTRRVKGNFLEAYGKEVVETNEILRELGAPESLTFQDMKQMTRGELIARLGELKKFIDERAVGQSQDPFTVTEEDAKLEALRGFWEAANTTIVEADPRCVPFSWVEPNSHEPSCIRKEELGRKQVESSLSNPNDIIARRLKTQGEAVEAEIRKLQERKWRNQSLTPLETAQLNELIAKGELISAQQGIARNESILARNKTNPSLRTQSRPELTKGIEQKAAELKEREAIAKLRLERAQAEVKFVRDGGTSREESLKLEEMRLKADIRETTLDINVSKRVKTDINGVIPQAPTQTRSNGGSAGAPPAIVSSKSNDKSLLPFKESRKTLAEKQLELNLLEQRNSLASGQTNLSPAILAKQKEVEALATKSAEEFYIHTLRVQEKAVEIAENRLEYLREEQEDVGSSEEESDDDLSRTRMRVEDSELALDELRNGKEEFVKDVAKDLISGNFKAENYLLLTHNYDQDDEESAFEGGRPLNNPEPIDGEDIIPNAPDTPPAQPVQ